MLVIATVTWYRYRPLPPLNSGYNAFVCHSVTLLTALVWFRRRHWGSLILGGGSVWDHISVGDRKGYSHPCMCRVDIWFVGQLWFCRG